MKTWESLEFSVPAVRIGTIPSSNIFLWVIGEPKLIVATELVYSSVYSRFLRLGDIVTSAGEYPTAYGTRGVIIKILKPFTQGVTDYIYCVAFENEVATCVKDKHLIWEKSQRIRIGKPTWR